MIREFSAGIIPFHEEKGERKYLILLSNLAQKEFWEFPKGLIEKGERAQQAAEREFEEEAGITDWELIPEFKKVLKYFYRRRGQLVNKSVTYFLGRVNSTRVTISSEAKDYAWVTLKQAEEKIKHNSVRRLLKEADEFVSNFRESTLKSSE
jgi:bis(5'-nucleosidyl)-tetraphosphatase